jgi:hypothetical protein
MLPLWQKYADGFVFFDDKSTDGTSEFLLENKEKYNIISVIKNDEKDDELPIESNARQKLYDEAFKHSGKIICMDSDEYLDGRMQKEELEQILDEYPDTLFHLRWIQYTDKNQIRVDGQWRYSQHDRVGSYATKAAFRPAQMHSEHLPNPGRQLSIGLEALFIAHLQWLDKKAVAVKQYFWKITDHVNRTRFNAQTIPVTAYDVSVNNFNWEYMDFPFELKVPADIYSKMDLKESYKYKFIQENVEKYNIPNLNDWGMGIHEGTL